jgi:hypothetical protein
MVQRWRLICDDLEIVGQRTPNHPNVIGDPAGLIPAKALATLDSWSNQAREVPRLELACEIECVVILCMH